MEPALCESSPLKSKGEALSGEREGYSGIASTSKDVCVGPKIDLTPERMLQNTEDPDLKDSREIPGVT
jgi:hypothetical protein